MDFVGATVLGAGGRGTPEHLGVLDRIDIITSTLGKALGGAAEVALLGHGDEVVELPDLHRGTWPFRSVGGVVVDRHPSY